MQPVNGDEFLRKVERRAEMIHTAVDVLRIRNVIPMHFAPESEDARPRCEY